ncbi:HAMP domain-containing histidine kinase [Paenibacillus dokdonensis]|uniref:Signal transduction histidine-protein kinase ArlS n=2 Tax=Paenibacillus dokdonensis TaxID=2567944 RepID=A0ABU6GWC0_9BACL|nr:HAMP domain-containing histidine kinase [Paenibacillus dokdonensis]MEC0242467.1 HAMP domain-containing histidine kinase [Paenibacillus dokdonensis]
MMNRIIRMLKRMPVIWKLMIGAALLIFLVFATYNFAQYLVLKHWMMKQEQDAVHTMMSQVQEYVQDKTDSAESFQLPETKSYMRNMLGKNQMIRIVDLNGTELLSVTNHFKPEWIKPEQAMEKQLQTVRHEEDHILVYRSPFSTASEHGTLEIASNLETFDHFNATLLWVMVIGGILAVCVSVISGWAIAKQFLRPVKALAGTIQNVKENGLQERVVNIENGDEFSELARLFNELMDQLEMSFRQQKQFVDDASHELRTPLTILEGHLNLLNRWGKEDPVVLDESLTASLHEVRRLKSLVQELLTLTRTETQSLPDHVDYIQIEPFLVQSVKRMETLHPEFNFVMTLSQRDFMVKINPLHLEQIMLILIENAVKYSGNDKHVHIDSRMNNGKMTISVQDHGIGIPSEELQYVFDRFYRVDKARNREIGGTGLGLSIARNLVQHYQGEINMTSIEDEGTRVTLTFPAIVQD